MWCLNKTGYHTAGNIYHVGSVNSANTISADTTYTDGVDFLDDMIRDLIDFLELFYANQDIRYFFHKVVICVKGNIPAILRPTHLTDRPQNSF